jgi:circadian clock protein KaiC
MRIPTGIEKLDELLSGGIPRGSAILIEGLPGAGKTTFCNHFLWSGVKKGEACIYVTFNSSPENIRNSVKYFGWEFPEGSVAFLDAYSWQTGVKEGKYIVNPADLTNFTIKLTKLMAELKNKNLTRVVFDSFSTMFLFVPQDLCLRFLSVISARLKAVGAAQLIVIEEGMHPPAVMTALNTITDGTIKFVLQGTERYIQVLRMRDTPGIPINLKFQITQNGIEIIQ